MGLGYRYLGGKKVEMGTLDMGTRIYIRGGWHSWSFCRMGDWEAGAG